MQRGSGVGGRGRRFGSDCDSDFKLDGARPYRKRRRSTPTPDTRLHPRNCYTFALAFSTREGRTHEDLGVQDHQRPVGELLDGSAARRGVEPPRRDGWELVSITSINFKTGATDHIGMVFKREKQQHPA